MQGDLGAEQNKLSLVERDTQPSADTQVGPWVLPHPLPIAAQAALTPAPRCMCQLQQLPALGIGCQHRGSSSREPTVLEQPWGQSALEPQRERGSIKHK